MNPVEEQPECNVGKKAVDSTTAQGPSVPPSVDPFDSEKSLNIQAKSSNNQGYALTGEKIDAHIEEKGLKQLFGNGNVIYNDFSVKNQDAEILQVIKKWQKDPEDEAAVKSPYRKLSKPPSDLSSEIFDSFKPGSPIQEVLTFVSVYFPEVGWVEYEELVVALLKAKPSAEAANSNEEKGEGEKRSNQASIKKTWVEQWESGRQDLLNDCKIKYHKRDDGSRYMGFSTVAHYKAAQEYFDTVAFEVVNRNHTLLLDRGFMYSNSQRVRSGMASLTSAVAISDSIYAGEEILRKIFEELANSDIANGSNSSGGDRNKLNLRFSAMAWVLQEYSTKNSLKELAETFFKNLLAHPKRHLLVRLLKSSYFKFKSEAEKMGVLRQLFDQGDNQTRELIIRDLFLRLRVENSAFEENWLAFLQWLPKGGRSPETFPISGRFAFSFVRILAAYFTFMPCQNEELFEHVMQEEELSNGEQALFAKFFRITKHPDELPRPTGYVLSLIRFVVRRETVEIKPESSKEKWDVCEALIAKRSDAGTLAGLDKGPDVARWLFFDEPMPYLEFGLELFVEWYCQAYLLPAGDARSRRLRMISGALHGQLSKLEKSQLKLATAYLDQICQCLLEMNRAFLEPEMQTHLQGQQIGRTAIKAVISELNSRRKAVAEIARSLRQPIKT